LEVAPAGQDAHSEGIRNFRDALSDPAVADNS